MIKKMLREPLIHFSVVALLMFVFFDKTDNTTNTNVIRISDAKIRTLKQEWQQRWRRPPSQKELDNVIRNRMIQKMRFMQDQQVLEPDQSQLQNWLNQHKAKYPDKNLYSFQQVFLGTGSIASDVNELIRGLNSGELTADEVSINLLVPEVMDGVSIKEVSRTYGQQFSEMLQAQRVLLNHRK